MPRADINRGMGANLDTDDGVFVRRVAHLHDKLNDIIEMINKCYSLTVGVRCSSGSARYLVFT